MHAEPLQEIVLDLLPAPAPVDERVYPGPPGELRCGLVTEAAPDFVGVEAHDLLERAAAEDLGEPPVTDAALGPQAASLH